MSIRKVKNKSGICYEVSFETNGSGSKRLRRRFERKIDAESFFHDFRTRREQTSRTKGVDICDFEETTFAIEAAYWLEKKSLRMSPGHLKRATGILRELLSRFGSLRPNRITPALIEEFQNEELAKGLDPATANRKVEVVVAILNFAVRHRRIPFNPATGFEKLKVPRKEQKRWEKADAISFLTFADKKYPIGSLDRWKYLTYSIALNAGLRASEIWGLQAQDISTTSNRIIVERQFDQVSHTFRITKGRASRKTPCHPVLRSEIFDWMKQEGIHGSEALFQNKEGNPISHLNFIHRVFKPDLERWGGQKVRFHDLRHTAVSLMIASGLDIRTVQEIAGHQDIHTTMGYAHALGERIEHAALNFSLQPEVEQRPVEKSYLRLL